MSWRLAAFDFDGTLADSLPWFTVAMEEAAARFGFRFPDPAEREALRGCAPREILRRLAVPAWKLPAIAAHLRRRKAEAAHLVPLFGGVHAMLRELADRRVLLAMVSSDSEGNIRRALGAESAARIAFWECGAALFGKPARLRRVLARSGVPAAQAIYIGDELRDAEAARAAGMDFGAVAWGYTTPAALRAEAPAAFFAAMAEIPRRFG
ncbi:HAD hydrolase-like protein [Crenalkalicoccus roseus]|uniref:HAD hydrolase-like protein n=1 Tax=Crenalkalicoccus roseus TaxID=1485588 RepID=UPI0010815031|nr:HAD hydrolase-like protein [Crenalkalicoccus roseus]